MKVTQVSLRASEGARGAGRPEVTPELLAASMARYSRNNEGLEAILSKVKFGDNDKVVQDIVNDIADWAAAGEDYSKGDELLSDFILRINAIDDGDLEGSVDSVLKLADYGHGSIRDLAPVAMFLDGLSIGLIALIWNLCPIGAGQESSSRYIKFDSGGLADPGLLGVPARLRGQWLAYMDDAFDAYAKATDLWKRHAADHPDAVNIPPSVLAEGNKAKVGRMERNYVFDRARVFIPVACTSNLALLMSAGEWVRLVQVLLSCPIPEAQEVGRLVKEELGLAVPRMTGHAVARDYWTSWWTSEMGKRRSLLACVMSSHLSEPWSEYPVTTNLDVMADSGLTGRDVLYDLAMHENRYAPFGSDLMQTAVRYSWDGIAMAEMRDLNRHRSGARHMELVPRGFHCASDQSRDGDVKAVLEDMLSVIGLSAGLMSRNRLTAFGYDWLSWTLLGTQFRFSHTTTADKMLYEIQLRTGIGAHYRYAAHERELADLWYERFPETLGFSLTGSAEPE